MNNQESIKKTIFLLGGSDLEMLEIQKILESNQIKFFNRNLLWGAKLSAYQDVFEDTHTFVGIELIEDCTLRQLTFKKEKPLGVSRIRRDFPEGSGQAATLN